MQVSALLAMTNLGDMIFIECMKIQLMQKLYGHLHLHVLMQIIALAATAQDATMQQVMLHSAKAKYYDASKLTEADHTAITCQACHDPHGSGTESSLRPVPVGSDTLGNGYEYTSVGGKGQVCMNCHKARQSGDTYPNGNSLNSHWGPHHSVQSDVFLGENAASFDGSAFLSGSHKFAIHKCLR